MHAGSEMKDLPYPLGRVPDRHIRAPYRIGTEDDPSACFLSRWHYCVAVKAATNTSIPDA
jgi:hypothetical protein